MNNRLPYMGKPRKCVDCGKKIGDGGRYFCVPCFSRRWNEFQALLKVWFPTEKGTLYISKPTPTARWN